MSAKSVEAVLSRAMNDVEFAVQLFEHPDQALSDYDLTVEELAKFERLSRADFEAFAGTLSGDANASDSKR